MEGYFVFCRAIAHAFRTAQIDRGHAYIEQFSQSLDQLVLHRTFSTEQREQLADHLKVLRQLLNDCDDEGVAIFFETVMPSFLKQFNYLN